MSEVTLVTCLLSQAETLGPSKPWWTKAANQNAVFGPPSPQELLEGLRSWGVVERGSLVSQLP